MKLCKNCKYCKKEILDYLPLGQKFPICRRPSLKIKSLYDGKKRYDKDSYCRVERMDFQLPDNCGPEGKYFEAKK